MMDRVLKRNREICQSSIRAITRRIEANGGINLGQGTCELPPSPELLEAARQAILDGHNSYTLFDGVPELKQALVRKYTRHNQMAISTENVLVTCGATGALECVCRCFLEPGDEVVQFAPIYQYHVSLVRERGATIRFVDLKPPDWSFSIEELKRAITPATKLLVFANPNNPTGKVFSRGELEQIGQVCRERGVVAVVDEVYEYMVYDGLRHISLASLPGMFEHTITLSSAGKSFFVTGWRVGWAIGPADVMRPMGVKSDETYVCAPAPLQYAVAHGLGFPDSFFASIGTNFRGRRQRLVDALSAAGLDPHVPSGAYYILAEYKRLGVDSDMAAVDYLADRRGVGSVPGSSFFSSKNGSSGMVRLCFAVDDTKLNEACDRLTQG
jgi:aminotransferase